MTWQRNEPGYQQPCYWLLSKYSGFSTRRVWTYWGRVTHISVGKLTTIGSDNGVVPGRHQVIIWTSAGILLIGPLGTNFSEILIGIQTFSFKKMHLKMSSAKWRLFRLSLSINLHRLISAAIGRWVTSDPAELPFLPGRKKLCTNAVEYNP